MEGVFSLELLLILGGGIDYKVDSGNSGGYVVIGSGVSAYFCGGGELLGTRATGVVGCWTYSGTLGTGFMGCTASS